MIILKEFPVLTTERLTLRQALMTDSLAIHDMLSIPEVNEYSNLPQPPTLKRSASFVNWMMELFPKGRGCSWLIEENASQSVIGAIRINKIQKTLQCGSLGYELHPKSWGKGYMTEALQAVVDCCFQEYELNRIEAWTMPGNQASDRVLMKNGFVYEGTLRQSAKFKGSFHDKRMFSLLSSDVAS